jgi:hypothetical protein
MEALDDFRELMLNQMGYWQLKSAKDTQLAAHFIRTIKFPCRIIPRGNWLEVGTNTKHQMECLKIKLNTHGFKIVREAPWKPPVETYLERLDGIRKH